MKRKFHSLESNEVEDSHGLAWNRGPLLGKGGFGSVYQAELKNPHNGYYPELMAIKSAEVSAAGSLQKEIQVYDDVGTCPFILDCYGDEITTTKSGHTIYNILLEYASGGALSDAIRGYEGCGMPESDVKSVTRCLLEGIEFIHSRGYVHCDLKPDNVLLALDENSDSFISKIGDFGLAKGYTESKRMKLDSNGIGGTPLYMAPETVIDGIQGPPCDIWALGCIVYEMLTGKQVWDPKQGMTTDEIFKKISDRCELPKIPANISDEGKKFLQACLVRNPMFRFTAGMLLKHQFVSGKSSDDKIRESLDEERMEGDDYIALCDSSSFTSPSREDDGVETNRRMFNNYLPDLPIPRIVV